MSIPWGEVSQKADRVLIVATGPSLRNFRDYRRLERLPGVYTIAVKQAIKVFRANAWVTVDPNVRARAMMQNQRKGTTYYAAVPDEYGRHDAKLPAWRDLPEKNVIYLKRLMGNGPLKAKPGLSENPRALHTGNSAWGALGVAYLMGAKKVALLGVDATQQAHGVGTGRPFGRLDHLPWLFSTAVPQLRARRIDVVNGNPESRVSCFPKMTIDEALEWIVSSPLDQSG